MASGKPLKSGNIEENVIFLRPYRLSDAERLYEILNGRNFRYFGSKPKTVAEERRILRRLAQLKKEKREYPFAIIHEKKLVGGCGIKRHGLPHIDEIGYFVAEEHWNKGIATAAVKELGKVGRKLGIKRLEIRVAPANKASARVAKKSGYTKKGRMKSVLLIRKRYTDADLYAKIL